MVLYAVIQDQAEPIPKDALIHAFCDVGGLPHADVSRLIRVNRGILWDRFEQDQAESVARDLSDQGFQVRVVSNDALPSPGDPRIVRWFHLNPEGLGIPDGIHGDTVLMNWQQVLVISSGTIAVEKKSLIPDRRSSVPDYDLEGLSTQLESSEYRKRSELMTVLDVMGYDQRNEFRYLRMPSNELSYGRILGPDTQLSRFERFQVVIEFIIQHADQAVVSPETTQLLSDGTEPPKNIERDGTHASREFALRQYNRWLLSLAIESVERG